MLQVDGNPPPDEPPDFVEGKVSGYIPLVMIKLPGTPLVGKNILMRKLLNTIGFYVGQVRVLVEDLYNKVDVVLYCKFRDVHRWCELKANIPVRYGWSTYTDTRIQCIQSLAWWVADLTTRGKYIYLNNFNCYIIADTIKESHID